MDYYEIPILLIIFNRPDTTRQVFGRIREIAPKRLYVAADAPREGNAADLKKCAEARRIVTEGIDWDCELVTFFRERNAGCRLAVSDAISRFFEREEYGIILEDDCLPDLSFFPFCKELLIKYKDDERVGHISGNNNFPGVISKHLSYDFSTVCHIWGWATWRRVWKHFDLYFSFWKQAKNDPMMRKRLFNNLREEIYFSTFLTDAIEGKHGISAWDAQYWYMLRLQHYLCIYPAVNLVTNIGIHSPDATHTKSKNKQAIVPACRMEFPLQHPDNFMPNRYLDDLTIRKRFFSYRRILRYIFRQY